MSAAERHENWANSSCSCSWGEKKDSETTKREKWRERITGMKTRMDQNKYGTGSKSGMISLQWKKRKERTGKHKNTKWLLLFFFYPPPLSVWVGPMFSLLSMLHSCQFLHVSLCSLSFSAFPSSSFLLLVAVFQIILLSCLLLPGSCPLARLFSSPAASLIFLFHAFVFSCTEQQPGWLVLSEPRRELRGWWERDKAVSRSRIAHRKHSHEDQQRRATVHAIKANQSVTRKKRRLNKNERRTKQGGRETITNNHINARTHRKKEKKKERMEISSGRKRTKARQKQRISNLFNRWWYGAILQPAKQAVSTPVSWMPVLETRRTETVKITHSARKESKQHTSTWRGMDNESNWE